MQFVWLMVLFMGIVEAKHVVNVSTARSSKMHELSSIVIKEAYKKAGLELRIHVLPTDNALQVANAGIVDGEISRTRNIRQKYSNLLRVPVEINYIAGVAFSKNPRISVNGWSSIQDFKIGIIKGCDFAARGTQGMNVRVLDNEIKAFQALERGKVDLVILPLVDGLQTLQDQKIRGVYALHSNLVHIPLYHYIHSSHSDLVPRLTTVLREMKRSGRIEQIRQAYLARLMMQL